jgi:hypothetical protein
MLDAYIIDRIRQEREQARDGGLRPLRIEPANDAALPKGAPEGAGGRRTPEHPGARREDEESPRGSVVIDFTI